LEPDEYTRMDEAEARMWWYRALHARLLESLPATEGPILDAGCGTGGFLSRIPVSREAFGIEWHASAAGVAATKSNRPVARASIHQLPFAQETFGAVVAADVLCHAAVDPAQALGEVRRVMRPKGQLIVNMPAFRSLLSAHDAEVHNARRMSAAETYAMLDQAGFRDIRVRYWNSLLLPLMIIQRKVLARTSGRSDVAAFPPWLDHMLHAVTQFERRLPFPLPAGGSVLAIAERP
jgi:SAM-dependent methyltransferase